MLLGGVDIVYGLVGGGFEGQAGEARDPGFNQFQFKALVPTADDGQQTSEKDLTKKGGKTQI
jgi:hypothetical protein